MGLVRVTRQEANLPLFGGIDVGGTTIKLGIVDNSGHLLGKTKFPTASEDGCAIAVQRMRVAYDQLCRETGVEFSELKAIGLATPGTMDIPRGWILSPPNLPGWREFPIRDELSKRCNDLPVAFANDANAAAYGEFWKGSGTHYHSIVMITLGTGVGGGIIIGDLSVDGEHSHGSECGHIIIDSSPDARMCPCGLRGHLEAYCSATAVVARTKERLDTGRSSTLNNRLIAGEKLSALMVAQEAEKGDELSQIIIDETGDYLARGIAILAHVIDPAAFVLGGAMDFGGSSHELGRRFLDIVRRHCQRLVFPVVANKLVVEFAELGGDAGIIGAAGLARALYQKPNSAQN